MGVFLSELHRRNVCRVAAAKALAPSFPRQRRQRRSCGFSRQAKEARPECRRACVVSISLNLEGVRSTLEQALTPLAAEPEDAGKAAP